MKSAHDKNVITYGTFDTLHWGHIEIFRKARKIAGENGKLYVGISTSSFNNIKGKKTYHTYKERRQNVQAIRYVSEVFPEKCWEQKLSDFKKFNIDLLVMGDDWKGTKQFNALKGKIPVKFFPRTKAISSSGIRKAIVADDLEEIR
jgi:glycerol-3-phosphate cytidylyltransferase